MNLKDDKRKRWALNGIFRVHPGMQEYYKLSHDTRKEREAILDGKLRAILSPPFNNIKLEDILNGKIDEKEDWKFHIQSQHGTITIAIKEEPFKRSKKTFNNGLVEELREQESKLYKEYQAIHLSICKHKQARFTVATNLVAELRRWDELQLQWQKYHNNSKEPFDNGHCIDLPAANFENYPLPQGQYADLTPSYQPHSSGYYYPPPQQPAPFAVDYSDISNLFILANQKYSEYISVLQQLEHIENSIHSGSDNISYKVEIGQIIPDNIEELLDCYYCNAQKSCIGCQELNNCDTLKYKCPINVYYEYMRNKLDLSTIARSAKDDFDIDFYAPMEPTRGFQYTSLPQMEDTPENTLCFTNEDGNATMLVEYEISDHKIIAIPNSNISNNIFPFHIPTFPAKLLNIKAIHEDAESEIFFTDNLEFTRYAKPTVDDSIITSYYGGQFGDIEVDFFPLQERTVHYLIFEYPDVSLDDAIRKACYNYQQMKKIPGLTVDFYFLDPDLSHSYYYRNKFNLEKEMTAEEFCSQYRQYMDNPNAEPTKSNSSASSQDKSNENAKESEMLLGPLIGKGKFILMAGTKHSGKTTLAISIAASVGSWTIAAKTA